MPKNESKNKIIMVNENTVNSILDPIKTHLNTVNKIQSAKNLSLELPEFWGTNIYTNEPTQFGEIQKTINLCGGVVNTIFIYH